MHQALFGQGEAAKPERFMPYWSLGRGYNRGMSTLAPLGWGGNQVTVPGQQTVRAGGSQQFPTRAPQTQQQKPVQRPPMRPGNYYTPPGWTPTQPAPTVPPAGVAAPPPSSRQSQPTTIVASPSGPRLSGANGTMLEYDTDPVNGGTIPIPTGLDEKGYSEALTPDMTYLVDDLLTTVPGPVGDQFRTLERRRAMLASPQATPNLTEQDRAAQIAALDQQWSSLRYSAMLDRDGLMRARYRQRVQGEREAAATDDAYQRDRIAQEREQEREREDAWRQAVAMAEANPAGQFRRRSRAEIEQEAEGYMAQIMGGQLQPQQQSAPIGIAPGDPLQYSMENGSWVAKDDAGRKWSAVEIGGTLRPSPVDQADADALPPGASMVVYDSRGRMVVKEGKAPKDEIKVEHPDAIRVAVDDSAQQAVDRRMAAFDRYEAAMERHQVAMEKHRQRKERDPLYEDPEPIPPQKPRIVAEAEAAWAETPEGKAGAPFDPSFVMQSDMDAATERYWAKRGVRASDVPMLMAYERSKGLQRFVVDGAIHVRVGERNIPAMAHSWRGRTIYAPTVTDAETAEAVVRAGVPFVADVKSPPSVLTMDEVDSASGDAMTLATLVRDRFPNLPREQQIALASALRNP